MGEWPRMASPIGLIGVGSTGRAYWRSRSEAGDRSMLVHVLVSLSRARIHVRIQERWCGGLRHVFGVVRDGESGRACIYVTIRSQK